VLLTPSLDRPTSTLLLVIAHSGFNSFRCNTYGPAPKCCKQRTYGLAKPFRCNIYKKPGVGPFLGLQCSVLQERARPSRDENPVTATPLFPTLTNCDACKPFRIRSYENCRVWSQNFHFGTPRTQTKGLHRALSAKGTLHFSVGLSLAGILFFHESRDTGHSHRCGSAQTPPAGSILWVVS
jgi:hypothetical protein